MSDRVRLRALWAIFTVLMLGAGALVWVGGGVVFAGMIVGWLMVCSAISIDEMRAVIACQQTETPEKATKER